MINGVILTYLLFNLGGFTTNFAFTSTASDFFGGLSGSVSFLASNLIPGLPNILSLCSFGCASFF